MRVLVTGAGGFIGSHLCEALLDEGHEVVGLEGFVDSYPPALKLANLAPLTPRQGFTLVEADLRTDPLRRHVDGVDVVVNEAAMAGLPRSWTELSLYAGCNLLGLQRLVDACHDAKVGKFVQISTSSVYGRKAVGDEKRPTRPVSPYGVTKLAAEHLLLAYVRANDFPATILRYFSIYGPRQRPDMAYRIFTQALIDGRPITMYGDGRQSRSNTYVSDCVRGTIQAIEGAAVGEVYNIGGGRTITLRKAIATLAEALGVTPVIERAPTRPGDQRHTAADTAKAQETFGYRPVVRPKEGLRRQVAWHLESLRRQRQRTTGNGAPITVDAGRAGP